MQKCQNNYFNNISLLENTLLPYFYEADNLKLVNKLFSKLNYDKYLTYLQPHGIVETYSIYTKTIMTRKSYRNGNVYLNEGWHENGQLWYKINFYNPKLDGFCNKWYDNGKLSNRFSYKNGKIHGLYEGWDMKGNLRLRYNCMDGKKDGLYEEWYLNGKLFVRENWKDGKLDGLSEIYGQSYKRRTYKNGIEYSLCENSLMFIQNWPCNS